MIGKIPTNQESTTINSVLGFIFLVIPLLLFISMGLGISGLFEKSKNKVLSFIGLISAFIQLLIIFFLFILGS